MKSNVEILSMVERLLRAQPRNQLVIEIHDALKESLLDQRFYEEKPVKTFDRSKYQRDYMREYMRKRRAKKVP